MRFRSRWGNLAVRSFIAFGIFFSGATSTPAFATSRSWARVCAADMEVEPAKNFSASEAFDLDLHSGHTIQDIPTYLERNLSRELAQGLHREAKVTIVLGSNEELIRFLRERGATSIQLLGNPDGFHRVHRILREGGGEEYVISAVNGQDRLTHVMTLLKMGGFDLNRVILRGRLHRWTREYEEIFRKFGPPPDVAVVGFRSTFVSAFLKASPEGTHLLGKIRGDVQFRDRIKGSVTKHEMDGMDFYELTFDSGKRAWFFNNDLGDRIGDIFEALENFGDHKIQYSYFGTAGSVTEKLRVGDSVVPKLQTPGKSYAYVSPAAQSARAAHVPTPNVETREWLRNAIQTADFVEVEWAHILDKVKDISRLSPHFVISDLLVGPHAGDYTMWNKEQSERFVARALSDLRAALGSDRVVEAKSVPLVPGPVAGGANEPWYGFTHTGKGGAQKSFTLFQSEEDQWAYGESSDPESLASLESGLIDGFFRNIVTSDPHRASLQRQEKALESANSNFVFVLSRENHSPLAGFRAYDGTRKGMAFELTRRKKSLPELSDAVRDRKDGKVLVEIGRLYISAEIGPLVRPQVRNALKRAFRKYVESLPENAVIYGNPIQPAMARIYESFGMKTLPTGPDASIYQRATRDEILVHLSRLSDGV